MVAVYSRMPFASVLVLGDNVYENGDPSLFYGRIEVPYAPLIRQGVKFYPVLGNHDIMNGHGEAQRRLWGAPPYYSVRQGDCEFFALDTTLLLPGAYECHRENLVMAYVLGRTQLRWLEKALSESTARFKIVFGHYPLYTSGMHVRCARVMRQVLGPLLEKYQVDVYLAGHEHLYERSRPLPGGMTHFVSGAGGRLLPWAIPWATYPRAVLRRAYHFMLFEAKELGLVYRAIGADGEVLDAGLLPKARWEETDLPWQASV